jgi:PAS domain S-box-containing protein
MSIPEEIIYMERLLDEPFILLDQKGLILMVNAAFEKALTLDSGVLVGQSFTLLSTDNEEKILTMLQSCLETEDPIDDTVFFLSGSGEELSFPCRAIRVPGRKKTQSTLIALKLVTVSSCDNCENGQLKIRTEVLQESEERLQLALEGANDGLWDYYVQEKKIYYSPRWFTMLGYEANAFPHSYDTWKNLIHPQDIDAAEEAIRCFMFNGEDTYVSEFRMLSASGNWRWILARGKVVARDKEGKVLRTVGTHTDISERKHVEEQLKILVTGLEQANNELEDFAYIISHDLKAPLRGISSLVSWIIEDYSERMDKRGHEYLDKLLKRTQRMHHLIEGILQYSRVGRGKIKQQLVNTSTLVDEVTESLSIPEYIEVIVHDSLPVVTYDKTLLQQVFQNLIGNALKYMGKPEGKINVFAAEDGEFYRFTVSDTGVGIEEKHFQRIFKTFQSLNPKKNSDSTGIGLSLVKKIITRNGGSIWLQSRLGEGSTFFFTIPKNPVPLDISPDASYTIMIIDDNKEFLEVAETLLELEGHKVLMASNTQEARDIFNKYEKEIHLVLMDVHIPGEKSMDRYRALRKMSPSTKIIACTGKDLSENLIKLKEAGVDSVLKKPFNMDQLNTLVEDIFRPPDQ